MHIFSNYICSLNQAIILSSLRTFKQIFKDLRSTNDQNAGHHFVTSWKQLLSIFLRQSENFADFRDHSMFQTQDVHSSQQLLSTLSEHHHLKLPLIENTGKRQLLLLPRASTQSSFFEQVVNRTSQGLILSKKNLSEPS